MKRSGSFQYKRPKLDIQPSQSQVVNTDNDDTSGFWGEDIPVDTFEELQQIEMEALSQISLEEARTGNINCVLHTSHQSAEVDTLKEQLQTKCGEITYLRRQLEEVQKKYTGIIENLNEKVNNLEKQSAAKRTEIEFQEKHALLLQEKAKHNITVQRSPKVDAHPSSPRCLKFRSEESDALDSSSVLHTISEVHEGELFQSALSPALALSMNPEMSDVNISSVLLSRLGPELTQLFQFSSFCDDFAQKLVQKIVQKTNEDLWKLFENLQRQNQGTSTGEIGIWLIQVNTDRVSLLLNSSWYNGEMAVHLRQILAVLSTLLNINESLIGVILNNPTNKRTDPPSSLLIGPRMTEKDELQSFRFSNKIAELCNQDVKNEFYFILLLARITSVLNFQDRFGNYLGLTCAIIDFLEISCQHSQPAISKMHEEIVSIILKDIILGTQDSIVVRYVIRFLNNTVHTTDIAQRLCVKSDADTFIEDDKCYEFSNGTCPLQVLYIGIESTSYDLDFVSQFLSWSASFTAKEYEEGTWLHNVTDTKLCECLPIFEDMIIRVALHSVGLYERTAIRIKKQLLKILRLVKPIFTRLRHHDGNFDIHISRHQGQYVHLLNKLKMIFCSDEDMMGFISQELERIIFNDTTRRSSQMETDDADDRELYCVTRIKSDLASSLSNVESLFVNRKDSFPVHSVHNVQNGNSDNDTDGEEKSVKDYLQSALTQKYFTS